MAGQHKHLRLCRQACLGYYQRWYFGDFHFPVLADTLQKAVKRVGAEKMHRNHQRRLERMQDVDHAIEVNRVRAIDRHQHDIDATDLVELLLRERVMQMAEMSDAQ